MCNISAVLSMTFSLGNLACKCAPFTVFLLFSCFFLFISSIPKILSFIHRSFPPSPWGDRDTLPEFGRSRELCLSTHILRKILTPLALGAALGSSSNCVNAIPATLSYQEPHFTEIHLHLKTVSLFFSATPLLRHNLVITTYVVPTTSAASQPTHGGRLPCTPIILVFIFPSDGPDHASFPSLFLLPHPPSLPSFPLSSLPSYVSFSTCINNDSLREWSFVILSILYSSKRLDGNFAWPLSHQTISDAITKHSSP